MPKISVIVPLYNKEKEIERTILSVLNQNFSDFELLIVNDGSTDHSLDVVKEIKDNRIRIISQQNAGVSAARNRGISEAQGEYILLLDADDILLSGVFDSIKEGDGNDIILGSFVQTDTNGNIVSRHINTVEGQLGNVFEEYWKQHFSIRMGNFLVKRIYLDNIEPFRTDITLYEDLEWLLRLLDNAKVFVSNHIFMEYKRGESGLSRGFKPIEKDFSKIATVKSVEDKNKRKIIGDFVIRRFSSRIRTRDWRGAKLIWSNNAGCMLYCLIVGLTYYCRSKSIKKNNMKNKIEEENVLPGLSSSVLGIRRIMNNIRSKYMLNIRYSDVCWGGVIPSSAYLVVQRFGRLIKM